MLLVFMMMASVVIGAAVIMTLVNSTSSGKLEAGESALAVTESGAENALLRLLRDPNYTGTGYNGEAELDVGTGKAHISVNNGLITAIGKDGIFTRTILVTTSYNNNVLTVISWREQF